MSEVKNAATLQGARIVFVDDDADYLTLYGKMLEKVGCEVIPAASAHEGYREVFRSRPDALICDLAMPGEDGFSLIRRIRREQGLGLPLPALALTSLSSPAFGRLAIAAGFDRHLPKGTHGEKLFECLLDLTARRRAETVTPMAGAAEPVTTRG
jgi:CheY-like chemotaxis protein